MSQWTQAIKRPEPRGNVYDPDKFYVRASDQKGHHEAVHFGCPPDVYAQIMTLVHHEGFPDYQSPGDFFRDAAVHHLQRRAEEMGSPEFRENLERIRSHMEIHRRARVWASNVEEAERTIDNWRTTLVALERRGYWPQMTLICDDIEATAARAEAPLDEFLYTLEKEWRAKIRDHNEE